MRLVRTIAAARHALASIPRTTPLGFVPTMGAWHEGHLELIRAARREGCAVVASIFVNPAQFDDQADLAAYPRDEAGDARMAAEAGVEVLFLPTVQEMYPDGFASWVDPEGVARGLEGTARPGHFRGVATVCVKLFHIVAPTVSFFGQKDAQQAAVIEQVVRDLNLLMDVRIVPTVRDVDGLALSSRNIRLSVGERARAVAIPRALEAGLAAHRSGDDPLAAAYAVLDGVDIEYVVISNFGGRLTLAIAARVGATRLIDNVHLEDASATPTCRGRALLHARELRHA